MGGWTLEAAEAVCSAKQLPIGVFDGLESLFDKSLIQYEVEARFGMLESIREYALEQVETSGEVQALRRGHAEYYLALAEVAEWKLQGAQPKVWLEQLEQYHNNLRAALQWSLEQCESATAGRLSTALGRFWWMHLDQAAFAAAWAARQTLTLEQTIASAIGEDDLHTRI